MRSESLFKFNKFFKLLLVLVNRALPDGNVVDADLRKFEAKLTS